MKYDIRSRGLLWGFLRGIFGDGVVNFWDCYAELGFIAQGFPALMSGQTLVLFSFPFILLKRNSSMLRRFSLMKKERKKSRLSNLWRERLRIGAQSEAISLRSTSTLCFFTNKLSFLNAKSSEAGLLDGSASVVKNDFFNPNLLRSGLFNGSVKAISKEKLIGCDVSYRQHDGVFYGNSIISLLKELWANYKENQRNKKEVQRRLLRKRAFNRRKASLHLKMHSLKLKAIVWLVLLFAGGLKLDAQELKALKVGEQMPDVAISGLLGFGQQEVRFSDLRGKVVLIDFWSNYCGSCIGGMAHLQDLKNNLKDSVVVLPVNAETKERIVKLWANNPTLKKLPIYTIYGDKTLAQLFPHEFFPHLVWIGKDGKYLGASSAEYANDKEVRNVYGGGAVSWEEKKDVDLFNPKVVALHKFLKQDTDDYFLPYLRGMSNQSGVVLQADSMLRYYVVNTQMANQYAIASESLGMAYLPKRRVLQLKDSMAYAYQKEYGYSEAWREKYGFSYERVFAKGTSKAQMYALMLQDLNAHYGLEGKMVNEPLAVLALRKNGALVVDSAKTPKTKLRFWIAGINQIAGLAWVVNETGLDEQTLMPVLPENLNKDNIKSYVKKMGLALEPSVKAIPMFHLKLKP